tara:strand:- start:5310 stop:5549 length:240 start_codon:yes stop_codon:yes gene_type:complete
MIVDTHCGWEPIYGLRQQINEASCGHVQRQRAAVRVVVASAQGLHGLVHKHFFTCGAGLSSDRLGSWSERQNGECDGSG